MPPLVARLRAPVGSRSDSPAFVDALRDQLGLRLVKSRGPIDTVAVDRLEPLIEN